MKCPACGYIFGKENEALTDKIPNCPFNSGTCSQLPSFHAACINDEGVLFCEIKKEG